MADDVTYTVAANATPPGGTKATTDETTAGPHSAGSHMGIAKLAVSADGDSTHVPATVADGLLVEVSNTVALTGGLTDVELRATPVPVSGTITVDDFTHGPTGATTSVADNAASVTLLASNANRVKAVITNDSSARLYLKLANAVASLTDYSVTLARWETWEEFNYTGEIRGIWDSDPGDGAARVTEVT